MKTVLLRFEAVMQSWGTNLRFDSRATSRRPSFSGVVGVLANALGRERSHPNDDLCSLRMACRTDRQGEIMSDFYTAGATTGTVRSVWSSKLGEFEMKSCKENVVGHKAFLSDACFTVALRGDDDIIDAVESALISPARALYLGRRSCPPMSPILLGVVDDVAESAAVALAPYPERHDDMVEMCLTSAPSAVGERVNDIPDGKGGFLPRNIVVQRVPAVRGADV